MYLPASLLHHDQKPSSPGGTQSPRTWSKLPSPRAVTTGFNQPFPCFDIDFCWYP